MSEDELKKKYANDMNTYRFIVEKARPLACKYERVIGRLTAKLEKAIKDSRN